MVGPFAAFLSKRPKRNHLHSVTFLSQYYISHDIKLVTTEHYKRQNSAPSFCACVRSLKRAVLAWKDVIYVYEGTKIQVQTEKQIL